MSRPAQTLKCTSQKKEKKKAVLAHEAGFLPQQLFLITFIFQQAALNRNYLRMFINM